MVVKGPERKDIIDTIVALRKAKAPMFRKLAQALTLPRRSRVSVNISKIARLSKPNAVMAVPGKVIGDGVIGHPVEVAALSFSASAVKKIEAAGGKCHSLAWLIERGMRDVNILK